MKTFKSLLAVTTIALITLARPSYGAEVVGVIDSMTLQTFVIFGEDFPLVLVRMDPAIPQSECTGGILVDPNPESYWGDALFPMLVTAKAANMPIRITYTGDGGVLCNFVSASLR